MYQTIIPPHFLRQLKSLIKKHRTLKEDVIFALDKFDAGQHAYLGQNVYKIRLKSESLARGKSKSFRLIVLVLELEQLLTPITIYFKGDRTDIGLKEINHHLEIVLMELREK